MGTGEGENKNWLTTLPGILTALATLVTAFTGGVFIKPNGASGEDARKQIADLTSRNAALTKQNEDLTTLNDLLKTKTQTDPKPLPVLSWNGRDFNYDTFSADTCKSKAIAVGLDRGGILQSQGPTWVSFVIDDESLVLIQCQATHDGYVISMAPSAAKADELTTKFNNNVFP